MEVMAKAKFVRRGPRKVRLLADLIRGQRVDAALSGLRFAPQHAAADLAKVVKSAAANAENNYDLDARELMVKAVTVDEGPRVRRFRPVSKGMAHGYIHPSCHITVVVEENRGETE
ncbi:MAG: 50S ribosomal protein L22 [Candidatus Dormibacteraceae bacterium]